MSKQCVIRKCLTKGRKLLFELFIIFFTSLFVCLFVAEDSTGGYSPVKVMGALVKKFREHPLKVPESCFMGVSQIHSTSKSYQFNNNKLYNCTTNINSNKDNYRTLSSQQLLERIIINLTNATSDSSHLGF